MREFQETQQGPGGTTPTAVPTTPADSNGKRYGLPIEGATGYRVSLVAADGETFQSSDHLACYVWHPVLSKWLRAPDRDLFVGTAATTYSSEFSVIAGDGNWPYYVPVQMGTTEPYTFRMDATDPR